MILRCAVLDGRVVDTPVAPAEGELLDAPPVHATSVAATSVEPTKEDQRRNLKSLRSFG
jgi:hypothetical protein